MTMRVLGLSFSGHGSAACLVEDGRIVNAVNLERLSRTKFALAALPDDIHMISSMLKSILETDDPPPIADVYEAFPDLLEAVSGHRTLSAAGIDLVVKCSDNVRPRKSGNKAFDEFCKLFAGVDTHFDLEHHLCHAYQAYLTSPFDETAVLTVDGRGEDLERLGGTALSTTTAVGRGQRIEVLSETLLPDSLGGLYSTATLHLGFRQEQEGNTMALASFGTDRYHRQYRDEAFELLPDGGFTFHPSESGDDLVALERVRSFCPPREPGTPFTQDHYDLAWAMQAFTEEIVVHITGALQERSGLTRLAIAGGVALNCVANEKILRHTGFDDVHIVPNAGDRGLCLGAALYGYHVLLGGTDRHPPRHDYLGPTQSDESIVAQLDAAGDRIEHRRSDDIAAEAAELVASGRIIGWVQGGAEFGPRALGHRSIIADPRTAESKRRMDEEIKRREWFRPYAPSALAERADEYFEMFGPSPYMLLAVNTRPEVRDLVPGIVHVDGSARVQTVDAEVEPQFHRLISCFEEITGVPLVMNTSFNGYGEPMVETAADGIAALEQMGLDALAVGDHLVWRSGCDPSAAVPA